MSVVNWLFEYLQISWIWKDNVWKIIIEDLGMQKVCAKMMPKWCQDRREREQHVLVCQEILQLFHTEPDVLRRVIAGDKTWIFKYESEIKFKAVILVTFYDVIGHRPLLGLAPGPGHQSVSRHKDPAVNDSLNVRKEMSVMAGQIVAASLWLCSCSQRREHLLFSDREEH